MQDRFECDGWRLVEQAADGDALGALRSAVAQAARESAEPASLRNVLTIPAVRCFAESARMINLVEPIVGAGARAVRGILFDKSPAANWGVGWHQDQVIAVAQQHETPGFAAWSSKAGVTHVKPPAEILQRMVTVRLHLDDCPAENGALQVLPGSHRSGLLDSKSIEQQRSQIEPVVCAARAGDALLMRPLLLHASTKSAEPCRRRVLHLEYATDALPGKLRWPDWSDQQ